MNELKLTDDERSTLLDALNLRQCLLETGSITHTAKEAVAAGLSHMVLPLSPSQRSLLDSMSTLAARLSQ